MSCERFSVSAAYGRCIEEANAAHAAYWEAMRRKDQVEAAACLKDRNDWNTLAAEVPRFVVEVVDGR